MKKLLTSILLAGTLALAGCGGDGDDAFTQGSFLRYPTATQGYFVNSATGSDTTGNFATGSPYATIQAAVAAAGVNNTIIVQPGNYAGTVNLLNGQRLLGSESTLLGGAAITRPVLTGNIDMADGNTIDFLRIQNTTTTAIDGEQQNGGTVSNCEITTVTNGSGVSVFQSSGSWTVSNNTITGTAGVQTFGVKVSTIGANTAVYRVSNNTINGNQGGIGFLSANTADVKALVKSNSLSNGTVSTFEVICGDSSKFCLDLETNTNDGPYSLAEDNQVASVLRVEQLGELLNAQPGGAGNTGTSVNLNPSAFTNPPTQVTNGECGPF